MEVYSQLAKANEQLKSVCNHNATQQPEITRLRAELAKANERADELLARVGEAEARLASAAITGSGAYPSEALNKFAIEKKIEGAKEYTAYCQYSPTDSNRKEWSEQLRKEQEQC